MGYARSGIRRLQMVRSRPSTSEYNSKPIIMRKVFLSCFICVLLLLLFFSSSALFCCVSLICFFLLSSVPIVCGTGIQHIYSWLLAPGPHSMWYSGCGKACIRLTRFFGTNSLGHRQCSRLLDASHSVMGRGTASCSLQHCNVNIHPFYTVKYAYIESIRRFAEKMRANNHNNVRREVFAFIWLVVVAVAAVFGSTTIPYALLCLPFVYRKLGWHRKFLKYLWSERFIGNFELRTSMAYFWITQ